jgi:hypothetical protein
VLVVLVVSLLRPLMLWLHGLRMAQSPSPCLFHGIQAVRRSSVTSASFHRKLFMMELEIHHWPVASAALNTQCVISVGKGHHDGEAEKRFIQPPGFNQSTFNFLTCTYNTPVALREERINHL